MGVFTTIQQQKSRSVKIFHFRHLPRQIHAKINIIQILGSYLPFDNHFNVLRFSGLFLTIQDQLMETLS